MEHRPLKSKAGFVSVMGRPNVGKSTLINRLLGQKIAAVSSRPQTTRKRQMGILTIEHGDHQLQIVFIDTPGFHQPRYKLGEYMNREAEESLEHCDAILFIVDASQPPQAEDHLLFNLLANPRYISPLILALNKIDLTDADTLKLHREAFQKHLIAAEVVEISATRGDNLDVLIDKIDLLLPEHEPFFPEDQITDLYERDLAADLIREAALELLRDEVPHGLAVRIDQYKERDERVTYIEATLFVEKESHKPIVIGKGGQMLKSLGTLARKKIEEMNEKTVFLALRVKVRKNWRNDAHVLRSFGY